MNPILSSYLKDQRIKAVKPYLKGDILDLGCGYGQLISALSPEQKYIGVDSNSNIISKMKILYPKLNFLCFDLEYDEMTFEYSFDTVVLLATIEHLSNPNNAIRSLKQYLKPNGRLVITTPTPSGNWIHRIGSVIGLFYMEAAREHKVIYNRKKLEQLLSDHGFCSLVYKSFLVGGNQLCVAGVNQ